MSILLISLVVVATVALFVWEKYPPDLVAMLVLGALLVMGLVTPAEGISGFSNPATITVAAMFVLSAGLQRSGALTALGQLLIRHGKTETSLLLLVMISTAAVSPFINNTAAVAVFLPLVTSAAAARNVSSSRVLIPLSFASQFGGVCTLIGTSTNLLVNSVAESSGVGAFSMFDFTWLGLIMVAGGLVYFLAAGRWILPLRRSGQLTETYELGKYITELRVLENSPLIDKTLTGSKLAEEHDINVLELLRDNRKTWSPLHEPLRAGDLLLVRGEVKELFKLKNSLGLELEPKFQLQDKNLTGEDLDLVEALLAPHSRVAGRTLRETDFRWRYKTIVLALHRRGQILRDQIANVPLRVGDALLLLGPKASTARLRDNDDFIILDPRRDVAIDRGKAPVALAILAAVVLLAAFNVLPIVATALLGCAAMILTRCLRSEDAYRAIDWKIVVLLAGLIPLGLALNKTGAAELLVGRALALAHGADPWIVLALIYLVTAVLTEFMSNNAAAVLLAPVAISTATKLGVDPKPFLVAVAFAASTSFATPFGYQTNTMVYNAGGYRFADFLKVGVPLNLLFLALATYFIPKFWPF